MNYREWLSDCKVVCIYLGNTCNFDCNYCDRGYISNVIGGQNLSHSDLKHIDNFFTKIFSVDNVVDTITFHGGEPFLYVKRMQQVLEILEPLIQKHNIKVIITTNASLILENKEFIERWSKYLQLTISYDFIFQEENRDYVDIDSVGQLCLDNNIPIMWQFVMPITDPRIFSLDVVKDIVDKTKYCKDRFVNLIPLRHHRGESKFKDFFDDIDLYKFSEELIRLITTLYNYNVSVIIDGNYDKIDKNYLGRHYKIILSPDGFIYPEYDFCEYRVKETRLGSWKSVIPLFNEHDISREKQLIFDSCNSCEVREECGIKYLYKLFDRTPSGNCKKFYEIINNVVKYNNDLKKKPTVWHWVNNMSNQEAAIVLKEERKLINAKDFKSFFVEADAINPVRQELTFSLLRRYNCYAGCHVCYTDRYFEKDKSKFSRYIPTEIPKDLEQRWFELFKNYVYISTHDELYYLKMEQPHLYKWYIDNADKFYFGSVTDNSYSRNVDIFINEIDGCKGIYEIAFSETWLDKVNFSKIMKSLATIYDKHKIVQLKVIQQTYDFDDKTHYKELESFCKKRDIIFTLYQEILNKEETIVFFDKPEQENFASYNEEYYSVCGQSPDYLQYDSFFITLVDAIKPEIAPYDVLDENFNYVDHLWKHLEGKRELYNRYYEKIKNSKNQYNKMFADYYKFVNDKLVVNKDYNFIPHMVLPNDCNLYWNLAKQGWTPTELGLINTSRSQNVIPLFTFQK